MAATPAPSPDFILTPFQERVLQAPDDCDLFLGGGRGGGKSFALAALMLRHVEVYGQAARMLFVRRSFSGMADFEGTCRHVFGLAYGSQASYNAQSHIWRFANGATLQLDQYEGPQDFAKYQGKSFTLIAVDEVGQYSDPAILDLLRSCLRAPAPIQPRFIMAANPGGAGHSWISRRHVYRAAPWTEYREEATDRPFINCPSTYEDNPNLDRAAYGRQLDAATSTDPELGKAWKFGDWSVARGAFFSSVLDEKRVMVSAWEPGAVPRSRRERYVSAFTGGVVTIPYEGWDLYLAHDYGVSAPSVTYVAAESPGITGPDGRFYPRNSIVLLDELATVEPGTLDRGMGYTVPRLCAEILEMTGRWNMKPKGVGDDAMFARTGSASGSIAAEFRANGVTLTPAKKGRRQDGWERMRTMLLDAGKPDKPGLYVSRRCSYWWDTVPSLSRDLRRPDDLDSRAPDHAADASRYAIRREQGIASNIITKTPY